VCRRRTPGGSRTIPRRRPRSSPADPTTAPPAAAALEALRTAAFRHQHARRVRGAAGGLAFVEAVGICSTFFRFPEGVACLWEAVVGRAKPRWPRRSHHDAGVGLTWRLKDDLPAARRVYYGKLLRGRPVLVALDLLPAFYALVRGRQRASNYRAEYDAGRLSLTARRLMDALVREHPQYTRELRANTFLLEPTRTREFERAMAELQQGLWVVKSEERYERGRSFRGAPDPRRSRARHPRDRLARPLARASPRRPSAPPAQREAVRGSGRGSGLAGPSHRRSR